MPRVSRGAALLIALVIATAGIGAVAAITLSSTAPSAEIGSLTQVVANLPTGCQYTVHLYGGTDINGVTFVDIGGRMTRLAIGGQVFLATAIQHVEGTITLDALIPDSPSLIGSTVSWVAVIVDEATGKIVAFARCGGPIIEDAIC